MNTKEITDHLEKLGYNHTWTEQINGMPDNLSFSRKEYKDKEEIVVGCYPSREYLEELSKLPDGTEFTPDFSRFESKFVSVYGIFVSEENFYDGSKDCITLADNEGEDPEKCYHRHQLTIEMLDKAIWIQNHPSEHLKFLLKAHLKNLEFIEEKVIPLANKYGYVEFYNSLVSVGEEADPRESSSFIAEFHEPGTSYTFWYETDCVTGDLYIRHTKVTDEFKANKYLDLELTKLILKDDWHKEKYLKELEASVVKN